MKWKFCPECGHKLEAEWKFCADCGQQANAPSFIWPLPYVYSPSRPYTHWTIPPFTVTTTETSNGSYVPITNGGYTI